MKKKTTAGNKAQNIEIQNYDLSKKRKKNTKDNKRDLQEPEIEKLDIDFSELDINFLEILNFEIDMQGLDMQELNIELSEIDLDFSDILDFKLVEMSDLDWQDLLEKLSFEIELPESDVFIEK